MDTAAPGSAPEEAPPAADDTAAAAAPAGEGEPTADKSKDESPADAVAGTDAAGKKRPALAAPGDKVSPPHDAIMSVPQSLWNNSSIVSLSILSSSD